MKQIFPTNESKVTMASNNSSITQNQYDDLVERVNEGIECSEEVSQKVDDLLKSQINQVCTNNLNANSANIDSICNNELKSNNGIFESVETTSLNTTSLVSQNGSIDSFTSNKATIGEVNSDAIITNTLSSTEATISRVTSESIETDSIKINGELGVNTLDVGSLSSDAITTPNLNAEDANIESINIEKEKVQESEIGSLHVGNAEVNTKLDTNYIVHELDPQEVNELGDVYLLFPQFTNGFYMVEADNDTNKRLWSFELTNSIKNVQFRWSESELGQLVDVKFKEDAAGISIVQVHIHTNEHLTLFRQSITTSNILPPTIYVEDQLPDIDPPKLQITHQSGTYIQDVIFTNKLHIDCLEMDALFMDCVGVYRELWLTCDFNQAGDLLEPIPTAGEEGQYIVNERTCGVVHPTWTSPAERVDSTCLNLTPSCVIANYDGIDYQGTYECEWFDQCPRYPIKHLNQVTCVHGLLDAENMLRAPHGIFTNYFETPHIHDLGGVTCTKNKLVYNSATEREEVEVPKQFDCVETGLGCSFVYPRPSGSSIGTGSFVGRIFLSTYGFIFSYWIDTDINPYNGETYSYATSATDDGKYYVDLWPSKDEQPVWDSRASVDGLLYKDIGLTTCVTKVRVWTDVPYLQASFNSPYSNCNLCFQYVYSDGTCSEYYECGTNGDVTSCYSKWKEVIETDASRWVMRCGKDYEGQYNDNYVAVLKKEDVDWEESDNNPIIYEATSCTLKPTSDLKLNNLDVDYLNVNKDAVIGGDLYVKGTTHTVEEETISTGADTIILRQNNNVGLANGEASGIIINKYDGTNNLALVTDCSGTLRVGEVDGESTTIENVYLKDGKYYSYNSETEEYTEIETSGELTAYDSKEIVDGYTHYTNAVFTVYNYENLSPVLGRDEITNMCDNALLKWNAATWEANTISIPTEDGAVLKYRAPYCYICGYECFNVVCSRQSGGITDYWMCQDSKVVPYGVHPYIGKPVSWEIISSVCDGKYTTRTDECGRAYTGCPMSPRSIITLDESMNYCYWGFDENNNFVQCNDYWNSVNWGFNSPAYSLKNCWAMYKVQEPIYEKVEGSYYWEKGAGIYCFTNMTCYNAVKDDIPNNSIVMIEECENNLRAEI